MILIISTYNLCTRFRVVILVRNIHTATFQIQKRTSVELLTGHFSKYLMVFFFNKQGKTTEITTKKINGNYVEKRMGLESWHIYHTLKKVLYRRDNISNNICWAKYRILKIIETSTLNGLTAIRHCIPLMLNINCKFKKSSKFNIIAQNHD